jgi:hypothetical protein
MTWEEHEEEYGIVVESIPKNVRVLDTEKDYSSVQNHIYHKEVFESEQSPVCFAGVRVESDPNKIWHIIYKDDLEYFTILKNGY